MVQIISNLLSQALADKLKAQLEGVRKAKETVGIKATAAQERKQQKEEKGENVWAFFQDQIFVLCWRPHYTTTWILKYLSNVVNVLIIFFQVVLLTRTDRGGNVRPLVDMSEGPSGGKSKKRRKKKNVPTHGTKGERERYFDDDDKYDLKSIVGVYLEFLGTFSRINFLAISSWIKRIVVLHIFE